MRSDLNSEIVPFISFMPILLGPEEEFETIWASIERDLFVTLVKGAADIRLESKAPFKLDSSLGRSITKRLARLCRIPYRNCYRDEMYDRTGDYFRSIIAEFTTVLTSAKQKGQLLLYFGVVWKRVESLGMGLSQGLKYLDPEYGSPHPSNGYVHFRAFIFETFRKKVVHKIELALVKEALIVATEFPRGEGKNGYGAYLVQDYLQACGKKEYEEKWVNILVCNI